MLIDQVGDFAVLPADRDDWPTCGSDAVKLARHDKALESRSQRYPMYVRNAQRILQSCLILVGKETKQLLEAALLDDADEIIQQVSAAHEYEDDTRIAAQTLCCSQDGVDLVGPAEISGIPDHEFVFEPPFLPQRVIRVRDGTNSFVVAPIVDDVDPVGR